MPRKDGQYYLSKVQIPTDLSPDEAQVFIQQLAAGLEQADPQIKARTNSDYQPATHADAKRVDSTSTMQPLYFCHNKFV